MDDRHDYDVFIGSDASTDRTNEILLRFQNENPVFKIHIFSERRGKSRVVNDLVDHAFLLNPPGRHHVLLFTDANVYLDKDCLCRMINHFQDDQCGLVDSRILQAGVKSSGISSSEMEYMNLESRLKHWESLVDGNMMGPFGGCFMVRSDYYERVPLNLLLDDFYISMTVSRKGGRCINDINAICWEGVPHSISEEFKRKRRISAGNFQNLAIFYPVLFQRPFLRAYTFLSHKVLRWLGPIFILLALVSAGILGIMGHSQFVWISYFLAFVTLVVPMADFLLEKLGVHLKHLRNIRYFLYMNLALLAGLCNYLVGIKSAAWQPPSRPE